MVVVAHHVASLRRADGNAADALARDTDGAGEVTDLITQEVVALQRDRLVLELS
jgi:hypothetical protein